jgi:xylulokinase
MNGKYILAYDLGTAGNKVALFNTKLELIKDVTEKYPMYYPQPGWAEQDADDYWNSVITATKKIIQGNNIKPEDIMALVFDCQMNCTVAIDQEGNPLMRCINWLDTRAASITKKFRKGMIKISGFGLKNLLMFIKITGGAPGLNGKDPISHILWIKEHQPDIYNKTYKFLSVKDFVIYKCTKNAVTSRDLGNTSWLMDSNPEKFEWSDKILKKFKIDGEKLPEIKRSTETAGTLTNEAAKILGLNSGTPVIVGSGDLTSAAIGSGAILENQLIICLGTSDWVAAHTSKRLKDLIHYTGSICSAQEGYLCISKQETGGACLDWLMNQMFKSDLENYKDNLNQLYKNLDAIVENTEKGAKNLIFTPWMFGERSPLNDPNVRGGFYNLSLDHTREDILRAVYEGIAFNIKWSLKIVEKLVGTSESIKFVGGGAKSKIWCQILADILDRNIHQISEPNLAAAKGSAIVALVGLKILKNFNDAIPIIKIKNKFNPNSENKIVYDKLFNEFLKIYKRNKIMFKTLNL